MLSNDILNYERILETAEGDEEFKQDLILALQDSLTELKETYQKGIASYDLILLKQARHKIKPTLQLFEMNQLKNALDESKQITETHEQSSEVVKKSLEDVLRCCDEVLAVIQQNA
ncbi:hypothetical protein [Penaeicola halotolerans]|uniref:hypothetical protein n=1 Tax=Penaeicola halotolerans TaxID=2793196 RepID=UPI001CF7F4B4|nr:hypothetical protein [Penaeicola halotolerans]